MEVERDCGGGGGQKVRWGEGEQDVVLLLMVVMLVKS